MNFKRGGLRKTVPLSPGCNWERHFGPGVVRAVITYLDYKAKQHPIERFAFVNVDTIVKWCAKYVNKPYSKRAVEYALAYLEELGIIVRVREMEIAKTIHHGFMVAPHDHACKPTPEGRCDFWCSLSPESLRFDQPGVRVLAVRFHGTDCSCEDCEYGRTRRNGGKS